MIGRGWAFVVLLAGCAPTPLVEGRASAVVPAGVAGGSVPVSSEVSRVAAARALVARRDVEVRTVSRQRLIAEALRQVDSEAPEAVLRERAFVLWKLGLAPEDFDFREALARVLERTLVGLYDPQASRVLLANDTRAADTSLTRFHELGHALVDQHFDLGSRVRYRPFEADTQAALAALSEGDASSLMFDLAAVDQGVRRDALLRSFTEGLAAAAADEAEVPKVVARLLAAPYLDGIAFVERLRADGGWQTVNDAWREPPSTSEQVLHPEAYARRERALEPPQFPPPGPGCEEQYADVLGEQTLRSLASEWLEEDAARGAFVGWGGDRVRTFRCPDGPAMVITLVGDDSAALRRMVGAFAEGARAQGCAPAGSPTGTAAALVFLPRSMCPRLVSSPDKAQGLPEPG